MKKLLALTLAALMVFGMVACASNTDSTPADAQTTEQADTSTEADASSESTEQADAPAETLIFGTSADYAPFEFMYPDDNGDMVYGGIDVSVAQYIADYTGKTLQTICWPPCRRAISTSSSPRWKPPTSARKPLISPIPTTPTIRL